MHAVIMGKLNARRKNLTQDADKGFTLIELLVVVIIIGILAAIAIPVYLGVQNNAKNSGTQSDITNLKTAVVSLQTSNNALPSKFAAVVTNGTFPAVGTSTTAFSDAGATFSNSTKSINYGPVGSTGDFCIVGVSNGGTTFYATSSTGVSTTACSPS